MRKSILVSSLITLFVLCYYAVTKGLDVVIGIALITSIISNILNIVCEVRYGKKD